MKLLLRNGLVYDGTTNSPTHSDILIEDSIIKQIGINLNSGDARIIDCNGLSVAPGFIDAHSHNDFFIDYEKMEEAILPFLRQGITTQIVGNCGFSAYGAEKDSQYAPLVGGGLFKVNHVGSLSEYREVVKDKLIPNIVPLIGHGTTRISVSGKNPKALSKEELSQVLKLAEEALKEGAFGGSFGLMYEPGMFADFNELVEYAKIIKKFDGILTIHTRANSKVALGYPLLFTKPHLELALDEVFRLIEETNVRVEYSHLIFVGKSSWKCADTMLSEFKKARQNGFEIAYDMYPFTYGASVITVILPSWYLKLPKEKRNSRVNRIKLKIIIGVTKKLLGIDYSDLVISFISKDHPEYEGKTVAEIAKEENANPFDTYLKLVDLSNGKGGIMLGKYYNEEIIRKMMNDELSIYMTDAWYEESGVQNAGTYQAFPLFLLKSKQYNIPLEHTISKMTGKTAERFRIKNRGYIREGYAADITIFDYNEISINSNVPNETPKGIKYVIVNGGITIHNNEYTNIKNGQLIRKL